MHSSNLTVQIWREADEGIGTGLGTPAPEFLGEVTARARRRIEAAVKSKRSLHLSHCPALRALARPAWGGRRPPGRVRRSSGGPGSGRRLDVADAFPYLAEHVDQAA